MNHMLCTKGSGIKQFPNLMAVVVEGEGKVVHFLSIPLAMQKGDAYLSGFGLHLALAPRADRKRHAVL